MPPQRSSERDQHYIRMACRLAVKAAGRTSPNPLVGAVLVKGNQVIATGYHRVAGGDHAEIVALKRAGSNSQGATLYINLEPCAHYGKTPPCAGALIRAGIKAVVAGMKDPNPLVAGSGFRQLKRAGINIRTPILEEECRAVNEAFIKYITRRLPFVSLKLAATLDGRIAAASGDAHWISSDVSRRRVHQLRNHMDAVLVGADTVLKDDPQLTCRISGGRNPWRVILDARLRIPLSARLLRLSDSDKTIIATSRSALAQKIGALHARGVQVWQFPLRGGEIAWGDLLQRLAASQIVTVLIEGGANVAASALRARAVDKILFFYAPKILGGDGRAMIDALKIRRAAGALRVQRLNVERSGEDLLVTGYFDRRR